MEVINSLIILFKSIKHHITNIIPEIYRSDSSVLYSLYTWFFIGIIVRVGFMPFAFHGDLLSMYHYSHLLIESGSLIQISPINFFQAMNLLFFSRLIPIQEILIYSGNLDATTYWLPVLGNINIFRAVFLLKLPYLIFDISISLLFLHIFKTEKDKGLRAFKFWILNPIIIFAVYIFGRFEVIPIFFILFCIFLLKEKHIVLAALSLGIAIFCRYYAFFFLPLFILLFCQNWTERIKVAGVMVIPLIIYNAITFFYYGTMMSIFYFKSNFTDYLLGMKVQVWESQTIFIFISAYIFFLLYVYYSKKNENPLVDFTAYSLIILLLLYATSIFHPQYFAWFIPFLALFYGYTNERSLVELHCLQVICFVVFTFYWGPSVSTWLFASLNPSLFISLPSPLQLIDLVYPGMTFLHIIRSVFSAVLLFMAVKIILILRGGPSLWTQN